MTDAELDAIIEAGTVWCHADWKKRPFLTDPPITLPLKLAADLVRAARELRELRHLSQARTAESAASAEVPR